MLVKRIRQKGRILEEKAFWNKLAERYDTSVMKTYSKTYEKTIEITRKYLKKTYKLLDYGCGTGIVTNKISTDVASILAIDISEGMIEQAKGKAVKDNISNVSYVVSGLDDIKKMEQSYDVITAFNVLYFVKDIDNLLGVFYNLLPRDGFFISVTDCLEEGNKLKNLLMRLLNRINAVPYMRHFTVKGLLKAIEKVGFEIVYSENLYDSPPNYFVVAKK